MTILNVQLSGTLFFSTLFFNGHKQLFNGYNFYFIPSNIISDPLIKRTRRELCENNQLENNHAFDSKILFFSRISCQKWRSNGMKQIWLRTDAFSMFWAVPCTIALAGEFILSVQLISHRTFEIALSARSIRFPPGVTPHSWCGFPGAH